jgi:hypothetical protein
MTLNPWKRARQLRGIITSLQDLVKSLQKVIETQSQFIALQQTRIDTLLHHSVDGKPVVDVSVNKFLN